MRTTNPGLTVPALRAAVAGIDPRVVVSSIDAVDHLYAEDLAMPRLMLLLMATFAVFGLLVAAAGIYGVLSHLVTERRREFGVRVALGARPVDIRRLVLRSADMLMPRRCALSSAIARRREFHGGPGGGERRRLKGCSP